ncbi:MAG: hypothetical protein R3F20_11080 [Planctomycetota bacterium]
MPDRQESRDVDSSLGRFEAALKAKPQEIAIPSLRRILAVRDGSDQDDVVLGLAEAAARRCGGAVATLDQPQGTRDPNGATAAILTAREREAADLVVVPAPFGDDYGRLREESLGVTVDMLLAECPAPVLIARAPVADADRTLAHPWVLIDLHPPLQILAAAWGAAFARGGGALELVAAPDPALLDAIRLLLGDEDEGRKFSDDLVERAGRRLSGGIVAAAQHLGEGEDFAVRFGIRVGDRPSRTVATLAAEAAGFSVAAYVRRTDAPSLSIARRCVLASTAPVLAVGSDA